MCSLSSCLGVSYAITEGVRPSHSLGGAVSASLLRGITMALQAAVTVQ